jgi:geranylgeranyl pyrophosphate synthase
MHTNLALKAKTTLENFVPVIDRRLAKYFDQEIKLDFGFNQRQKEVVREMLLHAKEHNLRPAKRIRASFVYYGYLLGKTEITDFAWTAAMAAEIVHTALLIHDDFMDRDIVRRGGATTHKYYEAKTNNPHYGHSMAVNIGDAILCAGFDLLAGVADKIVLRQMLRAIVNTAHGQAYDITLETLGQWREDDVIDLHKAKTAIYTYENPLKIGGIMAGLPEEALKILHDYAMDGGVAFQLQDDILGVFGTPEKTGKSADSDLLQGKCTMLVLKVLNDGTTGQQSAVRKVWGKPEAPRQDLDDAKQAIVDSGSLKYSNDLARKYAAKAAKTAFGLRNLDLNSESIDYIQGIAEYMVNRKV